MNFKRNDRVTGSTGDLEFDRRIEELVQDWQPGPHQRLYQEMITTILRMAKDEFAEADLKLISRTLKELRNAANVFRPYQHVRKVTVFGSARTAPEEMEFKAAEAFGRKLKDLGFMVLTGGGDGIMGAAQKGAGRRHSFGLNINLPFEQRANETIEGDEKLVIFNYFFTRKLNFLKETHAIVLFPGGFGTMDEGFEALTLMQTGKARIMPLILVDKPGGTYWKTWYDFVKNHLLRLKLISPADFHLFSMTDDIDVAAEEILLFYKNFHSYRWVRDEMSIRIMKPLTEDAVKLLDQDFRDLLVQGNIRQRELLPQERNEPKLASLPRIVLSPDRHQFGRIRQLIDAINRSPVEAG